MVELGHGAPAAEHGEHHLDHGFLAEAIALGQVIDDPQALGGELFHGCLGVISSPYPRPSVRFVRWGSKCSGHRPSRCPLWLGPSPDCCPHQCLTVPDSMRSIVGLPSTAARWRHTPPAPPGPLLGRRLRSLPRCFSRHIFGGLVLPDRGPGGGRGLVHLAVTGCWRTIDSCCSSPDRLKTASRSIENSLQIIASFQSRSTLSSSNQYGSSRGSLHQDYQDDK